MDIKAYIESGVIECYVMGMADAQEVAELEQLSRQHPEIRNAIDAFEASLAQSALAGAMPPPAYVKQELFTRLAGEFKEEENGAKVVPMSASRFSKYIAAAAVVLLVVSASLNVYYYNRFNSANTAYQALLIEKTSLLTDNQVSQTKMLDMYQKMQMMSDPSVQKVSMPSAPGTQGNLATVYWDSKTKDVYLLANQLPQAPAGMEYQLWAMVDGKPVDAGMMGDCAGLCKMKNMPTAQAFAITLEKKGGSPVPTMSQLHVFGKVS